MEERFVKPMPDVVRQRDRLGFAEDVDRLSRGVDHQPAVLAARQMHFDVGQRRSIEIAVEVLTKLANDAPAVHAVALRSRTRPSFWRNFRRARNSLDFTAASEIPSILAVSSVESCSVSRNKNTVRYAGSRSLIALDRMEFISVLAKRC